jgi:pimeloyl-ACP methyl ester carboxylesterase
MPTLIVWGEADSHVPVSDGLRLRDRIAGSRLIVFRNCGHLPPAEQPGKFVEVLTRFCSEAKAPSREPLPLESRQRKDQLNN